VAEHDVEAVLRCVMLLMAATDGDERVALARYCKRLQRLLN
jgi:hypothetical protein